MRAWAKGLFSTEAAVELLIRHGSWLYRTDFLEIAVDSGQGISDGAVMAVVDWEAAVAALGAGRLPCSGGEGRILRLAASIAVGIPVDLREALTGLDKANSGLAAAAVLHAAGYRNLPAWRGAW